MSTTQAVVKIRLEKENSGLYGIWTHDLCDTGVVLYQPSEQANWELVVTFVRNKPWSNESMTLNI